MKKSQALFFSVLTLIFALFISVAEANTKIAPTEAEPGHPFTIIDTPEGRLIDGSVAVFKLNGLEVVLPGRTHKPYNTMQGRLAPDMFNGEYTVFARQPDGTEFEIGLFTVLGATVLPPSISPDIGLPGDTFTIIDSLARIQSGDLVVFYAEGSDPVTQSVVADNIIVINSTTLTAEVPWGATGGVQNFVSVRPTLTDPSRFGDLGFFVTALTDLGEVSALYNTNGADWNDYVQGSDITNATDTACDATTDTTCLHGGVIRMVELTGVVSCTGITASDALDAFEWTCDESTGTARIISTGLKDGKGLANLLDFSAPGWAENRLTVYDGSSIYGVSNSSNWWSNPVMTNTTGGALGVAGTVYVVPSNTVTAYEFTASHVALVAAPGVVINGPAAGADSYVIKAINKDFLWIEGMTVNAAGDKVGVYGDTIRFSTMQSLTAVSADTGAVWREGIGIWLRNSSKNTLSNVTADNNADVGIWLWTSTDNTLSGVIASNNYYGVRLYWSANNNTLSGVTAINNSWIGVHLSDSSNNNSLTNIDASGNEYGVDFYLSSNNRLTDVTASNNSYGVTLCSSSDNRLTSVTAINNDTWGIGLNCSSNNNMLMGVTASNNSRGVVLWPDSSYNTLSDVTASNNSNYGFTLWSSSNNYFTGELQVGNNFKDCDVSGGTNPGLVDSTCANNGASDATLTTGVTIADSFVAKVSADDSVNTSDTGGTATITDLTQAFDWTNFENTYRAWGVDGSTFPDATNRGKLGCSDPYPNPYTNQTDCEVISGTWTGEARIWDWSLLATDTVIKDVLSLPTDNDTLTHTWSDTSTSTILRNAVEIMGDSIGNDDLLCESGETCFYTPNIGSYQGHGSLISAGNIGTGGTIENVTLWKYETNGY